MLSTTTDATLRFHISHLAVLFVNKTHQIAYSVQRAHLYYQILIVGRHLDYNLTTADLSIGS